MTHGCGLALATFAAPVFAEPTRREVGLTIEDCSPSAVDLREAYAAAALELDLVDSRGNTGSSANDVELAAALVCERGVKARLTLKTAQSTAERTITLDDANVKDRPRLLALALAELVRAEWRWVTTGKNDEREVPAGDERRGGATRAEDEARSRELPPASAASVQAEPKGPPPRRTSAIETDADAASDRRATPERGFSLEALARLRVVFGTPSLLYGAFFGARWRRWSFGVEGLFGRAESGLGTANLGFADGRVGLELVRFVGGRFGFSVEPGVALGATWLAGAPALASVEVTNVTRIFADARLALRAELGFAPFSPTLTFEAGRASGLAATEGNHTMAQTGGWFAGAALGATLGATDL